MEAMRLPIPDSSGHLIVEGENPECILLGEIREEWLIVHLLQLRRVDTRPDHMLYIMTPDMTPDTIEVAQNRRRSSCLGRMDVTAMLSSTIRHIHHPTVLLRHRSALFTQPTALTSPMSTLLQIHLTVSSSIGPLQVLQTTKETTKGTTLPLTTLPLKVRRQRVLTQKSRMRGVIQVGRKASLTMEVEGLLVAPTA